MSISWIYNVSAFPVGSTIVSFGDGNYQVDTPAGFGFGVLGGDYAFAIITPPTPRHRIDTITGVFNSFEYYYIGDPLNVNFTWYCTGPDVAGIEFDDITQTMNGVPVTTIPDGPYTKIVSPLPTISYNLFTAPDKIPWGPSYISCGFTYRKEVVISVKSFVAISASYYEVPVYSRSANIDACISRLYTETSRLDAVVYKSGIKTVEINASSYFCTRPVVGPVNPEEPTYDVEIPGTRKPLW